MFQIAGDVLGMKPDSLKVVLEDYLHVSGDRKVKTDTTQEEYLFEKHFKLGTNLDTFKITAHLADGSGSC
ncbi:hypothetical protein ACHAXA_006433 [Cyclostephanos tholiformis]|uniref:SHSP domain-containing protein n=1 Tax=Cyclostephanos tholiformis TaxID=382380 RepID=A0ABD3RCP6_9STRA